MSTNTHIQTREQGNCCTVVTLACLRKQAVEHLQKQVLDCWFPTCIDSTHGGFHQDFSRNWSRKQDTTRSLVFQSRMTWVASEAVGLFPDKRDRYLAIAKHGLDGIKQHLADPDFGGYYFATNPPGSPQHSIDVKHAYGMAFLIYASATASLAGASDDAKAMAIGAFTWLTENAWDNTFDGCHEALDRAGKPLPADTNTNDSIGTPTGCKTMNTHIHLLEAFTALYKVWPDPIVRNKITALHVLITEKMWVDAGSLHTVFSPDWTPVSSGYSFGHNVETGYLLVESIHALGTDDPEVWDRARVLVDHAIAYGLDNEHGGFFDSADADGAITDDTKTWWVQAEALNALCLMHTRFGNQTDRYLHHLLELWSFISEYQTDNVYGGWHGYLSRDGKRVLDEGAKATKWKTSYHNARALMNVIRLLPPGSE